MAFQRGLRLALPKPKTFLGLVSLQTGTEMVSLALLINKAAGLFGLLAMLTGFRLNGIQLASYLYSVIVLVLLALLIPHIRKQSPFHNLALAWLYIVDTLVNTSYTAAFAVMWYVALGGNPQGDAASQATDTATSMVLIVVLTLVRVYFSFVVMSFARQVLLRRVQARRAGWTDHVDGSKDDEDHDNVELAGEPFAVGSIEGEGWKGKLGRAMVSVGRSYWSSGKADEELGLKGRTPLAASAEDGHE